MPRRGGPKLARNKAWFYLLSMLISPSIDSSRCIAKAFRSGRRAPSTSRLWAASLIGIGSKCQAVDDEAFVIQGHGNQIPSGLLSNFLQSTRHWHCGQGAELLDGRLLPYIERRQDFSAGHDVHFACSDHKRVVPFIHCDADVPVPEHLSKRTCNVRGGRVLQTELQRVRRLGLLQLPPDRSALQASVLLAASP